MHSAELSRGPASSRSMGSTADCLIDQNAALWASLRPPPRPSWPVLVRQRVSELSLASVGGRLNLGVSRWLGTRETARRWLLSATGGIALGLALGVAARFSESPPPELEEPPIAAQPAASPRAPAEPVAAGPALPVQSASSQSTSSEAAPAAPAALAPEAPPELGSDAPKLAEPAPAKRAAVSKKKKKPGASAKRRARKSASKRKRSVTSSR